MVVLLLDDEPLVLEMQKEMLADVASRVFTSVNINEALEFIKTEEIETCVLDYKMPLGDGLLFVEQAKRINSKLKFIMCSGFLNDDLEDAAKKIGIGEVLNKPFEISELIASLHADT